MSGVQVSPAQTWGRVYDPEEEARQRAMQQAVQDRLLKRRLEEAQAKNLEDEQSPERLDIRRKENDARLREIAVREQEAKARADALAKGPQESPHEKRQREEKELQDEIDALDDQGLQGVIANADRAQTPARIAAARRAQAAREDQARQNQAGKLALDAAQRQADAAKHADRERSIKEQEERLGLLSENVLGLYRPKGEAEAIARKRVLDARRAARAKADFTERRVTATEQRVADTHAASVQRAERTASTDWANALSPKDLDRYVDGPEADDLPPAKRAAVLARARKAGLDQARGERADRSLRARLSVAAQHAQEQDEQADHEGLYGDLYLEAMGGHEKDPARAEAGRQRLTEFRRAERARYLKQYAEDAGIDVPTPAPGGKGGPGGDWRVGGGAQKPGRTDVIPTAAPTPAPAAPPAPAPPPSAPAPAGAYAESQGRRVTGAQLQARKQGQLGPITGPVQQDEEGGLNVPTAGGSTRLVGTSPAATDALLGDAVPYAESEGRRVYVPKGRGEAIFQASVSPTERAAAALLDKDPNAQAQALLQVARDPERFRRLGVEPEDLLRQFPDFGLGR